MKLLVVRHAIAEDRAEFARSGKDDHQRPLSAKGRRRFKAGAAGIASLVGEPELVASSPLVRARQTADLLAAAWGDPPREETGALAPGAHPRELAEWLQDRGERGTVAVVGHEPHLSHLVSWLTAGSEGAWIRVKKGSAVLLDLSMPPAPGSATLLWALAPAPLRRLGA